MAVGSVDRLEEIPERVQFVFEFDAAVSLLQTDVAHVVAEAGARQVIAALPDAIEGPLLDKEAFRAAAARVRERTGLKGKALFHPIRVALTGIGRRPRARSRRAGDRPRRRAAGVGRRWRASSSCKERVAGFRESDRLRTVPFAARDQAACLPRRVDPRLNQVAGL